MKTHVAAQPFLRIKHLAAVLADKSAPGLRPVCGTAILLVTVGHGRKEEWEIRTLSLITDFLLFFFFFVYNSNPLTFFFFGDGVSLCCPDWSAVAPSRLTVTSTSWVQVIFVPQPPK